MTIFENILNNVENTQHLNETFNEVLQRLNEDRTISSVVKNTMWEIERILKEQISSSKTQPCKFNYVTFKEGNFRLNLFEKNVVFKWKYYSFPNGILKRSLNIGSDNGSLNVINENNYEINFIIKAIQGNADLSRSLETIQHELEHLWEILNYGKSYTDNDLYGFSQTLMDSTNTYEIYVGCILYLSRKWEQRAYANGVYSYLMKHPERDLARENIKETQLYKGLLFLKESLAKIKNLGEDGWFNSPYTKSISYKLKTQYKTNYNKLIKIGENAVNDITRILGRTLSKVEDDIKKEINENAFCIIKDFDALQTVANESNDLWLRMCGLEK